MAYERNAFSDYTFPSGSTLLTQYKVCALNTAGAVVHTTGSSGRRVLGVLQEVPSASTSSTGKLAVVRVFGVSKVRSSSRAIAIGNYLRATSGAAATSGGTVRPTTANTQYLIGVALTSAAATTARNRLVSMLLLHSGRTSTA